MQLTNPTKYLLKVLKARKETWKDPYPWAIGYSGGVDSGVLLWAMAKVVGPDQVVALHVDHGWRPEAERLEEITLVEGWCRTLGIRLVTFPPPPGGTSTEESARNHRFSCFQIFLKDHPASPVFLAHHADDQSETVLMRILRGRSWQGLGGMAESRGPFRRPLLSVPGQVLKDVAREWSIPFFEDSTNKDERMVRNYLRQSVFPLLEKRFPRAKQALNDLAGIWSQAVPASEIREGWIVGATGGRLDFARWNQWSELEKQVQLVAVASRITPGIRFSRRFLERITCFGRTARVQGSFWSFSVAGKTVFWERVVQRSPKEYFIKAKSDVVYDLGDYKFTWSVHPSEFSFPIPAIDPAKPLIWRSAVDGMVFSSLDDPVWTQVKRKRRLGPVDSRRCALLIQEGLLRVALDPGSRTVLWSETGAGKLNKTGIFVTLVLRSDYERR